MNTLTYLLTYLYTYSKYYIELFRIHNLTITSVSQPGTYNNFVDSIHILITNFY